MRLFLGLASLLALLNPTTAFITTTGRAPATTTMKAARGSENEVSRRGMLDSAAKFTASLGLISLAGTGKTPPVVAADIPAEGTKAPDFTLPSNSGSDVSLKDLLASNKYTVLYFYPGAFTYGCTIEAKAFQRDIAEFNALNAQIIGVSVDTIGKNNDFKKSCSLDFTLLSDPGAKVSALYGTALDLPFLGKFSNRQTYIIAPNGKIIKVFVDVESRIPQHSSEVLEFLRSIQKA